MMKFSFEELTGRKNDNLTEYQGYLIHKDILAPLKFLQDEAKKQIGADIKIISSYRDYERQKLIWNNKVLSKRPILNDAGEVVNTKNLTPLDLIQAIMRFSALPGASRHHWGTDLDIYDASKLNKEEVNLTPQECSKGGPCFELHIWLDEFLKSDLNPGFFRPYDTDLGGVSVEKWHLSFAPIANLMDKMFTIETLKSSLNHDSIELKAEILKNLDFIFSQYLKNITQSLHN